MGKNTDKDKEKSKYEKFIPIAVLFIAFYAIYAFFKWLFTSNPREIINSFLGIIVLLFIAVLFYLLSCWITGMPIELDKLFGFG